MTLRTRQRAPEVPSLRPAGKEILVRTNQITPSRNKTLESVINLPSSASGLRVEVTTDETHGRPPYRTGGPFCNVKLWYPDYQVGGYTVKGQNITQPNSTTGAFAPGDVWTRTYSGAVMLAAGYAHMSSSLGSRETSVRGPDDHDPVVNPDDLSSLGPDGWNKLRPKVEKAGLAQAILELREAPKMLKSTAESALGTWHTLKGWRNYTHGGRDQWRRHFEDLRKAPKPIASEFLNVQFGWKPFVRDVISVCDVVLNLDEHIKATTKRNNAWQKRSWREEVVGSSSLIHSEGAIALTRIAPLQGNNYIRGYTSNYSVFRESVSEVWYEGVFKFYSAEFDENLQSGYPALRRARQLLGLLGGNITPTVLYKVTPWTWLADWFSNIGANVQMLEDQISGQVASKYMYLMRYCHDQYRYYTSSLSFGGEVVSVEATRRLAVKRRVQSAGNFEFSLRSTPLSGTQLAILAALGITRT